MTVRVRRALISVSDKAGLTELARELVAQGVELISTGGTVAALKAAGIAVTDVSSVTRFPEILDGRVKTLHPMIYGGLLAVRGDQGHMAALQAHGISGIELLVVNLYPFEQALARQAPWREMIENIDIGGPAMIRAAAKNNESVAVVVDPADYRVILHELKTSGGSIGETERRRLAAKAFSRTASYDAAIAGWLNNETGECLPNYLAVGASLVQRLRYGENPHQVAALYACPGSGQGLAGAEQLQGKELSYNNLNDADAAVECLSEFPASEAAACVIVKHANPCGVATAPTLREAYSKAFRCDPVSAFGGIIALNRKLDRETAEAIVSVFAEVIVVPAIDDGAREVIASKKNLRLLLCDPHGTASPAMLVKSIRGGLLLQSRDSRTVTADELRVVTRMSPTQRQMNDMVFAFRVAKHVKSNAIVFARDGATLGIGAGQMSRVDSVRIAARKGEDAALAAGQPGGPWLKGCVVASDAFFPFADGLLAAIDAGASAVIQPGGSLKDEDVIQAADKAGIAMVLTGVRHFRH